MHEDLRLGIGLDVVRVVHRTIRCVDSIRVAADRAVLDVLLNEAFAGIGVRVYVCAAVGA